LQDVDDAEIGEERSEVATDDLPSRPPERLFGDFGANAVTTAELHEEERRCAAGEEESSQHRPKRLRLDGGAGVGGDRLGGRIGLLCGKASLLDRERREVAGRVDVGGCMDPPVGVGRNEAVAISRDPFDPRAFQPRKADHSVGPDTPAGNGREPALGHARRDRIRADGDPVLGEQGVDCRACPHPEERQGRGLGRDEGEPRLDHRPFELDRGEQRKLVEGERPAGSRRNREDEMLDLTRLHPAEQTAEPVRVSGPAKGQRSWKRDLRAGAAGEEDGVVLDSPAALHQRDVLVGIERVDGAGRELGARRTEQIGELPAMHSRRSERLRDGEGAVEEMVLRGHELDVDEIGGERTQRERCLEPGHAASDDEHVNAATLPGGGAGHGGLGRTVPIRFLRLKVVAAGRPRPPCSH